MSTKQPGTPAQDPTDDSRHPVLAVIEGIETHLNAAIVNLYSAQLLISEAQAYPIVDSHEAVQGLARKIVQIGEYATATDNGKGSGRLFQVLSAWERAMHLAYTRREVVDSLLSAGPAKKP